MQHRHWFSLTGVQGAADHALTAETVTL